LFAYSNYRSLSPQRHGPAVSEIHSRARSTDRRHRSLPARDTAGCRAWKSLVHAIRTVADGDALLHPALTRRLLERFTHGPRPGATPAGFERLTDRELDRGEHG